MKFNQNKYIQDWQKENMASISCRYNKDFVEEFKSACKEKGFVQSLVVREAMENIIGVNVEKELIKFICVEYSLNSIELAEISKRRFLKESKDTDKFYQKELTKENEAFELVMNKYFNELHKKYLEKFPNTGRVSASFSYDGFKDLGFVNEEGIIDYEKVIKHIK